MSIYEYYGLWEWLGLEVLTTCTVDNCYMSNNTFYPSMGWLEYVKYLLRVQSTVLVLITLVLYSQKFSLHHGPASIISI